MKSVTPSISAKSFNCPHCGAFSAQNWHDVSVTYIRDGLHAGTIMALKNGERKPTIEKSLGHFDEYRDVAGVYISHCFSCKGLGIWVGNRCVFPQIGSAILGHSEMPSDVRIDFDEAKSILDFSPRGAAALLRLAFQKLCKDLGQKGENINEDIRALVANGISIQLQQAMDSLRVIGNNAVHPGQIDLKDDRQTAEALFHLLNLIVEKTIAEQKQIDQIYNSLPASAREMIAKRDGKN